MLIICEILEREALSRMARLVEQFDYGLFGPTDGILIPIDQVVDQETMLENNYFLVPASWRESLESCQLLRTS